MVAQRIVGALLLLLGCAETAEAAQPADIAVAQPASIEEPPAEEAGSSAPLADPAADDPNKWKFATIGYVWFAGAKGETDVIGPLDPVGLDLSFGDVLKGFKFAFMGAAEAKKGRVVILGDLMFIHLEAKEGIDIRNQDFLDAELDSRTAEVTLVGGYRVVDQGPVLVDLMAGGRMNFFSTELRLEGPNQTAEGKVKESWFDPLVATRVTVPLDDKWRLNFYGDVGGFGIGADVTWQAIGTVSYDISRKISIGAGWRGFKVNYDKGDFLYDVAQNGPVIVVRSQF